MRDKLSAEQRAKFDRGTRVGELARELFPGGVNLAPRSPSQYQQAVRKTAEALEQGQEIIYEASFQYDRVLVILDLLVKKDGKYFAYEVKSSKKISDTYLSDAALQYYVITNSGIDLQNMSIIHVNPEYLLGEKLELVELFHTHSVLDEVREKQSLIAEKVESAKEALKLKKSPKIDIGEHCFNPYPCDFIGHCWKHVKENSVFELLHLDRNQHFELYRNGTVYVEDLNPLELTELGKKEYDAFVEQKPYYNWNRINHYRSVFKDAFYVMEIVFVKPAVPAIENTQPYELLPAVVQINDHKEEEWFSWNLESGKLVFDNLEKTWQQIKAEAKPVFVFLEDPKQMEYLKEKLGNIVYNLYDLFAEMDYVDARLHGDLAPANIAEALLDANPFNLKDIPGPAVASIRMEQALFGSPAPKNGDAIEKIRTFVAQYVEYEFLLLKHINELI